MLPPLNFGTVVFVVFTVGGILCPVAALRNRRHEYRWVRAALRLLGPFLFGMGFLSLVLRYNTLHLGRSAYGSAWVVNYTCSGATLALMLLLAVMPDTYSFLSPPAPGSEPVPHG